jgi:hypothetical protein
MPGRLVSDDVGNGLAFGTPTSVLYFMWPLDNYICILYLLYVPDFRDRAMQCC